MGGVKQPTLAQQRSMAQRMAAQQNIGLRAAPKRPTLPGPMTQQETDRMKTAKELDAAMPKQVAGQMAAFNAAQNKNTQGANMNAVMQRSMQQYPSLTMPVRGSSSMDEQSMRSMEAAPRAPQKTFSQPVKPSPASMAPPAMRKGGAVKKKPGYAKGGMVMANCGASMKPQQKAKK
jgi:hypothetical protein